MYDPEERWGNPIVQVNVMIKTLESGLQKNKAEADLKQETIGDDAIKF